MQSFHEVHRNFRMVRSDLLLNDRWSLEFCGRDLDLSITSTRGCECAVVAITETGGVGSVFDANPLGVECYLGSRGDGSSEALARALVGVIGTRQVLLTLAVRDLTPAIITALLASVRAHTEKIT